MHLVNILDAYNNNNLQYTMETRLKKLEIKLEINFKLHGTGNKFQEFSNLASNMHVHERTELAEL